MAPVDQGKKWGLHTPDSLRDRAQQLGAAEYLIKGLLPARSLGLLLGDSGLGKSPLMYQVGICIAAGLPFLGRETKKGSVVIADFENGLADISELMDRISRHLGLSEPPSENLQLWSLNDCDQNFGQLGHTLLDMLRDVQPALVTIDSFASYMPEAEEKNSASIEMLKDFRALARDCGTAVLFVHHRRKQSRNPKESAGPLEGAILRSWFQDSRGASALINGSDIRLGVDEPDLGAAGKDNVALVLRGFGRIRGDIGPVYLARDVDDGGDPLGYRQLTGPQLLFNNKKETALANLAPTFTFKEAKLAYGHGDQATSNFLGRCIDLQLVRKVTRGCYEQVPVQGG